MASDRELKQRIRSVKSIGKITSAMKMVANSQVRRVEKLALEGRAYAKKLNEVVGQLSQHIKDSSNPLFEERVIEKTGVIVIGADKGLCGAYNSSLARAAIEVLSGLGEGKLAKLLCLGSKAERALVRAGYKPDKVYANWEYSSAFAIELAEICADWFLKKEVDEVILVFTDAISMLDCQAKSFKFLPLVAAKHNTLDLGTIYSDMIKMDKGDESTNFVEYIFEPDLDSALNVILPAYMNAVVAQVMLESKTSEIRSRLRAMTSATENAENLTYDLTLQYYRARQNSITTEIIEISSGAEALKG
ncbi:ATP synthase F1 subunit gamma [bacterium]|nr:ATP synthase F1 subunit gamma [bacterium]